MIIDLLMMLICLVIVFTAGLLADAAYEWWVWHKAPKTPYAKKEKPLDYYAEWEEKILKDEEVKRR